MHVWPITHTGRLRFAALFGACFVAGSPALSAQQAAARSASTPMRTASAVDTLALTLDLARAMAVRQNPDLAVARMDIEVARGQLRQAGAIRTNPSLDVLTSGARGSATEIGISQEIEVGGQRGVRRQVGRAELDRSIRATTDVGRLVVADVDRAFYQVFAASRRVELSQEVLGLNERLSDVANRQLREGEVSKLDYNLAVIELGRSRARHAAALRERDGAELELRRLLGLAPGTIVRPVVDSTHRHVALDSTIGRAPTLASMQVNGESVDALTARALAQRPDLQARIAVVTRTGAEITLAQREALPNIAARLTSEASADGSGRAFRPGIGITLPLLNRNRGEIDARRAAARQAELDRASLAQRVRAEVEAAVRTYAAAAAQVEVLESTVLVPARENRLLLEAAYREGKVGLPVLLLIRNQVIDAEQEYWSAWLAEREALAALAAATGDNVNTPGTRVP